MPTHAEMVLLPRWYWEYLTTGLRIVEFRDLARNLDPEGDDARPDETLARADALRFTLQMDQKARVRIAAALRHAANVQERSGPPLTTHARRAMRAAIRRPYGGRVIPAKHPLVFFARQATLDSPWPSRRSLRTIVRHLVEYSSKVPFYHNSGPFFHSRERAYRTLDVALEIENHSDCIAALRVMGAMMPDASHLATGLAWDVQHQQSDE